MHIKLISPKLSRRPMDSLWKTRMSPPLGLLILAALTPGRHRVALADENIERLRLDDKPDLVGITVKADTFDRSCAIARSYRCRGIPVVFGGIHPTACPEACAPHADAVVVGEAEAVWPGLLDDAQAGRLAPVYRNDHPVDIALAPVPRWELLKGKNYLFTNTICIGRGCPWRCDFCYNSAPNMDRRYRMKPTEQIVREIESLGVNHVLFIDDNFIGDPERARTLVTRLRAMRITWHAAVSADITRHGDLLDRMAESGCRSLFIGFESVNQQNMLACHKTQNRIGRFDDTIRAVHQRGVMVNASVVFGFDGDDAGVFDRTVEWLEHNRVSTMTAHILTPYPGTRLHSQLEREGRIVDRDLRHYNTSRVVFRPARMTARELEAGYRHAYNRFYSWASIWKRQPVAAGQMVAYLEFNLVYRKFGRITCRLGQAVGMRRMATLAKAWAYPAPRLSREAWSPGTEAQPA